MCFTRETGTLARRRLTKLMSHNTLHCWRADLAAHTSRRQKAVSHIDSTVERFVLDFKVHRNASALGLFSRLSCSNLVLG